MIDAIKGRSDSSQAREAQSFRAAYTAAHRADDSKTLTQGDSGGGSSSFPTKPRAEDEAEMEAPSTSGGDGSSSSRRAAVRAPLRRMSTSLSNDEEQNLAAWLWANFGDVRAAFLEMDESGDCQLSPTELHHMLQQLGFEATHACVLSLFDAIDEDASYKLTFNEFSAWMHDHHTGVVTDTEVRTHDHHTGVVTDMEVSQQEDSGRSVTVELPMGQLEDPHVSEDANVISITAGPPLPTSWRVPRAPKPASTHDRAGRRWRSTASKPTARWAQSRITSSTDTPWARMDALRHLRSYDSRGATLTCHRPARAAAYLANVPVAMSRADSIAISAASTHGYINAGATGAGAAGTSGTTPKKTTRGGRAATLSRSTSLSGPIRMALLTETTAAPSELGLQGSASSSALVRASRPWASKHRVAPALKPQPSDLLM